MTTLLRHLLLLALSAALSWWFLLRVPPSAAPAPPSREPLPVAVLPVPERDAPAPEERAERTGATQPPEPETEVQPEPEPEPLPPPPERGSPDGADDAPAPEEPPEELSEEPPEEPARDDAPDAREEPEGPAAVEELAARPELLEAARAEFAGEERRGFDTVLLAAPEQQLEIARAFGEELVLVPKSALDPREDAPRYFRLRTDGTGAVESIAGRPPLERYRQYRDLFDYEYERLPAPLRALRRSVLSRDEIYLFAALLPVPEWAVVVGRRREALSAAGRELEDVERFVLRYVPRERGGFDLRVEEIVLTGGGRVRPVPRDREPRSS